MSSELITAVKCCGSSCWVASVPCSPCSDNAQEVFMPCDDRDALVVKHGNPVTFRMGVECHTVSTFGSTVEELPAGAIVAVVDSVVADCVDCCDVSTCFLLASRCPCYASEPANPCNSETLQAIYVDCDQVTAATTFFDTGDVASCCYEVAPGSPSVTEVPGDARLVDLTGATIVSECADATCGCPSCDRCHLIEHRSYIDAACPSLMITLEDICNPDGDDCLPAVVSFMADIGSPFGLLQYTIACNPVPDLPGFCDIGAICTPDDSSGTPCPSYIEASFGVRCSTGPFAWFAFGTLRGAGFSGGACNVSGSQITGGWEWGAQADGCDCPFVVQLDAVGDQSCGSPVRITVIPVAA